MNLRRVLTDGDDVKVKFSVDLCPDLTPPGDGIGDCPSSGHGSDVECLFMLLFLFSWGEVFRNRSYWIIYDYAWHRG